MLARASSDAGTRLRRSKSSTSTAQRYPAPVLEPLDPEVARQQAVAAATAAFARAQALEAADGSRKRSSEVSRSKSNASRKSVAMQGQGSHFPPRGSSFRSVHSQKMVPEAVSHRPPRTLTMPSRTLTVDTETLPSFHPVPSVDRPGSAPKPLSTQPSISFGEYSRQSMQSKTGRQSASSSVTSQQIRKARSMYYASSVQTGSPIARPPTMYLTTPPPTSASPTLDVPSPLPPARVIVPSPLAAPRIPVTVETDESIETARDKYLQSFHQRSVKHKPSLFLAPFIKRQDKSKARNKRPSSGFVSVSGGSSQRTPTESTTNITMDDFMPRPLDAKEKRSFSGSLKSKIKRVFRRTSKPASNLPVQQIQASRDYFGAAPGGMQDADDLYAIPCPDENVLRRVRARTPSYEPTRAAVNLHSESSCSSSNPSVRSQRSIQSLHSEVHAAAMSASRVTSWDTTSTQDKVAHKAIKRLTIIHESKDSIGSATDGVASLLTKRRSLPPGTLAAFRDPMPIESLSEEASTPIDPKRVFSALMKEITTSKSNPVASDPADRTPGAESDVFESSKTKVLHASAKDLHSSASLNFRTGMGNEHRPPSRRAPSAATQSTQSKASSIRTLGRAIRSTIRTVTPGEQRSSPDSVQPASAACATARIPRDDLELLAVTTTSDADEHYINLDTSHAPEESRVFSPSRELIERRVSKAKERWKTPLDDVAQLQFPRETERTYNVAEFTQHTKQEGDQRKSLEQVEIHRTDIPGPSGTPCSPTPRTLMSPLSPSVYSRDTDGISILPNDSVMSFHAQEGQRHHNGGSAVILTSQSVRSYVVGTPSPQRPDSARSSRDWKAWLSHEVSSMEFTSQGDLKIDEQYLTPTKKHREAIRTSHTEQDDTTVILRSSCDTITPAIHQATPVAAATESLEAKGILNSSPKYHDSPSFGAPVLEKSQSHTDTFKKVTPVTTPTQMEQMHSKKLRRPGSTPLLSRQRPPLTPSHTSSTSQPLVETPRSAFMNDRFPFIDTGRRSSSNSARSSRASRSPSESVTSSIKSTKATSSPRIYSDLSVPPTRQTSQRVRKSAPVKSDYYASKENLTPASTDGIKGNAMPSSSPLGTSARTRLLQPLSSRALNRSTSSFGHYTSSVPEIKAPKNFSSPVASTPPRIRGVLRPASPEKFARRPKSAFDLRGIRTSIPRPASDVRKPALQLNLPASSLVSSREPSPGAEERAIDSILEEGEHSRSSTPSQRMADRFLHERKSTGILKSEKLRGGMKLVREDTPAFL